MCLAVPTKIESIDSGKAVVSLAGATTTVAIDLVPDAKVGDYVLVHAGFALTIVDEAEAKETFAVLRDLGIDTNE